MLKSVFLAFILISLNSSGQSISKFTTKDFIELLVIAEIEKFDKNRLSYVMGSLEEPIVLSRASNGQPIKIMAFYRIRSLHGKQEINNEKDWIEIVYDNGLPFSLTFSSGLFFILPNDLSPIISDKFNQVEIQTIIALNKKYREKCRKSSPSYQTVIEKHNSYPASFNITNNLQELTRITTTTTYTREYKGEDHGRAIYEDIPHENTFIDEFYKNITNHKLVIKGIMIKFDENAPNHISFEDESKILEPGHEIKKIEIIPSFDDYYHSFTQYIGDIGELKTGLPNSSYNQEIFLAKNISGNEIEVNSYTNLTDIHLKKGDKIYFKTRGQINVGLLAGFSTPAGIAEYSSFSIEKAFKHAALLGRLGEKEPWFLIGNGGSYTATKDGTLEVMVNDNDRSNNSGSYYIEYSINIPLQNSNSESITTPSTKNIDKNFRVKITTEFGTIMLKLYNETPLHRNNFLKLVKDHFYDGLLFHRIIKDFMIQGGDPESRNAPTGSLLGNGGSGMDRIPAEFNPKLIHKRGALAAARDNNPFKASSACQFYIVEGKPVTDAELDNYQNLRGTKYTEEQRSIYKSKGGVPFLDMQYTVFGEVETGMDVVFKIATSAKDNNNRPLQDIKMNIEVIE